jgi:hypothetical protein
VVSRSSKRIETDRLVSLAWQCCAGCKVSSHEGAPPNLSATGPRTCHAYWSAVNISHNFSVQIWNWRVGKVDASANKNYFYWSALIPVSCIWYSISLSKRRNQLSTWKEQAVKGTSKELNPWDLLQNKVLALESYSGEARFESQLGYQLYAFKFFRGFNQHLKREPGNTSIRPRSLTTRTYSFYLLFISHPIARHYIV